MSNRQLQEGFDTLIRGHNENLDPQILAADSFAYGLNLSLRGGLPETRPAFIFDSWLPDGKFQGSHPYRLNSADRIAMLVDGRVWTHNMNTGIDATSGHVLNGSVDRGHFVQADSYLLVQDGYVGNSWAEANWPVILDKEAAVDQTGIPDHQRVPKGSMMAYGQGRIFVAVNYVWNGTDISSDLGRVNLVAGDIIKAWDRDAILSFIENFYLNEGGAFKLANELGLINGMIFVRNAQTGTGQGPLIVLAEFGGSSFAVQNPRGQWKEIDIGRVLFENQADVGTISPDSLVTVNNDIPYRSRDGVRTYRYSTGQAGQESISLKNDPLSYEIEPRMTADDETLLPACFSSFHNNRLFVSTKPERLDSGDIVFDGVACMDTAPASMMSGSLPMNYNGYWTGLKFMDMFPIRKNGVLSLYAVAKHEGKNALFRVDEGADTDSDSKIVPTTCRLVTRDYVWQEPFKTKKVSYVDLWITNLIGSVDLSVYMSSDAYPYWALIRTAKLKASGRGQSRKKLRFSVGDTVCLHEGNHSRSIKAGESFRFAIEWKGRMKLLKAQFVINDDEISDDKIPCKDEEESSWDEVPAGFIDLDHWEYEI